MKSILTLFKKFLPKTAAGAEARTHPTRDWLALLGAIAVLLVVSIAWNIWFFGKVARDEGGAPVAGDKSALETYPAGTLQQVFTSRKEAENAYRGTYQFVDPSK